MLLISALATSTISPLIFEAFEDTPAELSKELMSAPKLVPPSVTVRVVPSKETPVMSSSEPA